MSEPTHAWTSDGKMRGRLTGGSRPCRQVAVRWSDGTLTWPCTRGMFVRADGDWQIEKVVTR